MSRPRQDDHIKLANTPTGDNELSCANCGTRLIIVLPIPLAEWVRITKSFARAHQHCPPASNANLGHP